MTPRAGLVGLLAPLLLAACDQGASIVRVPRGFPPMIVPADNPTTEAGIVLGRVLYYDARLSHDGQRACADCHPQSGSFTSDKMIGVLPHINLAWSRSFLWTGGTEGTLEDAMTMEVEDFFHTDVERLRVPDLQLLFLAAFGSEEITTKRAAYALAQFQRTLVSGNAPYDRYLNGDTSAMSPAAIRGEQLFYSERGDCMHCHATRLFTDNRFHNNGLDLDAAITERGRSRITKDPADDGKYKTPTLRNVAVTAPYMHDDRFATLEEVIDFYSDGVRYSRTVDSLMQNVHAGGLHLTPQERADLVAFLGALTDDEYLSNPALAAPR